MLPFKSHRTLNGSELELMKEFMELALPKDGIYKYRIRIIAEGLLVYDKDLPSDLPILLTTLVGINDFFQRAVRKEDRTNALLDGLIII